MISSTAHVPLRSRVSLSGLLMTPSLAARTIEKVTSHLPGKLAAHVDLAQPRLAAGFGAFNGQLRRDAVIESLLDSFPFDLVIEAGTYRGTTTERLREMTTVPIMTIELSHRYHEYARRRLSGLPDVAVIRGDSALHIRRAAASPSRNGHEKVFAYLDAHWGPSLPTRYELLELLSGWETVCAVIDDFKVPGDPGYGYDDYGPGLVVDQTLLAGLPLAGVALFFPSIPSVDETGFRRGWAVLARGRGLVDHLRGAPGLALASAGTT
jgi:hypothetical protein